MSTGWIIAIIVIALGIIVSNIMLVKKTAKMKMPSLKDLEQEKQKNEGSQNKNQGSNEDKG
ncbi:DUF2897 family protein [Paraneptunicella aestuarii]|uniref:DUF2897 family protein n=1 Tax=Paraneptunicella aestuarii TaxID=2831148 RepID=UPI001E5A85C9|nr:DUF2897 family protein [Paraneptunicella aestuarii]UAA37265.1 DUF2897 family protein [Paraneptunicella aestuarii]